MVLLLHGASYDAAVWDRTGILDSLTAADLHAIAVDLPGTGDTAESLGEDPGRFLRRLIDELGVSGRVIVVAPSASGRYVFDLLQDPGAEGVIAGLVPVAPVGVDELDPAFDPPPALVAWGADDDVIAPETADVLAEKLGGADVELVEGGGHAFYEEDPDALVEIILTLVDQL